MNKRNLKRLQERIKNLMQDPDKSDKWANTWDRGFNAACEQILEIIEEIKEREI